MHTATPWVAPIAVPGNLVARTAMLPQTRSEFLVVGAESTRLVAASERQAWVHDAATQAAAGPHFTAAATANKGVHSSNGAGKAMDTELTRTFGRVACTITR
jgi:hypothetical protein